MNALLNSRKFWIMIADVVFSMALYFVGKYGAPNLMADVKFLIATIQPVIIAVIGAIAWEDNSRRQYGVSGE